MAKKKYPRAPRQYCLLTAEDYRRLAAMSKDDILTFIRKWWLMDNRRGKPLTYTSRPIPEIMILRDPVENFATWRERTP